MFLYKRITVFILLLSLYNHNLAVKFIRSKTIEEVVREFLANELSAEQKTLEYQIIQTFKNNDIEKLKEYIEQIQNINAHLDCCKRTLLHLSISYNYTDITQMLLLNKKADPNVEDYNQQRPLHYSTWGKGCLTTAQLLIQNGADIHAVDHEGKNALDHALDKAPWDHSKNIELIAFLKQKLEENKK